MPSLIERIKIRIADRSRATDGAAFVQREIAPPATAAEVYAAEQALGFPLPPLLRQLYLEAANGGFGPGYGFIRVPTQTFALAYPFNMDIVETYRWFLSARAEDKAWEWRQELLPACDLGCGMYECVDCSDPTGPVTWFEPNPRDPGDPVDDFLILLAPSLARRLEAWLDDEDLMGPAYETSALKQRFE